MTLQLIIAITALLAAARQLLEFSLRRPHIPISQSELDRRLANFREADKEETPGQRAAQEASLKAILATNDQTEQCRISEHQAEAERPQAELTKASEPYGRKVRKAGLAFAIVALGFVVMFVVVPVVAMILTGLLLGPAPSYVAGGAACIAALIVVYVAPRWLDHIEGSDEEHPITRAIGVFLRHRGQNHRE